MSCAVALHAQPGHVKPMLAVVTEVVVGLRTQAATTGASIRSGQASRLDGVRDSRSRLDLFGQSLPASRARITERFGLPMSRSGSSVLVSGSIASGLGTARFAGTEPLLGLLTKVRLFVPKPNGDALRRLLVRGGLGALRGLPLFVRGVFAGRWHPVIIVSAVPA